MIERRPRHPASLFEASAICLIGALAFFPESASAVSAADTELPAITVTATRSERPAFDVPASIDVVSDASLHGDTLGVTLAETLSAVPGLLARDRQNYAQDEQISIRGFGARSTFGVRGVRLYIDGIPATQPDGQGQVSHFNLASADRVEILRGPFSALYGNSSGGVVQLFTADGITPPQLSLSAAGGSYGSYRTSLDARGVFDLHGTHADYNAGYTHFATDGFRDHSSARRESFNGKLNLDFAAAGRLTLLVNALSSPESQDPLGLTRAQFDERPTQASSVAAQFDTRKSVEQNQGGGIYQYAITPEQGLRVLAYGGNRQVRQYLSTPTTAQASPLSSGGVVDLGTDYGGADARWNWRTRLLQRPFTLTAGASYDLLSQARRGYENFVGDQFGVQGRQRRDERDQVYDLDQYLQAEWLFAAQWSTLIGVRHSAVRFRAADHFITADNPDDGGRKGYYASTPVAGLIYKPNAALHLYASYGEGFETPTLTELAYRPDGSAGLNFDLAASRSNNAEAGAKLRFGERTQAQLVLFQAITRKELVVDTNANGRSTYENAGRTRRQGIEAGISMHLASRWKLQLANTYLDATVRAPYLTCVSSGCATADTIVPARNRIAGVPQSNLFTALAWGADTGWHAALQGQYLSAVPVNDSNSEQAPAYGLIGIDGGYVFDLPHWRVRSFVRLDNLLDTAHVGSVIVNDGNGRYYEPGPGRSVLAGLGFDWKH